MWWMALVLSFKKHKALHLCREHDQQYTDNWPVGRLKESNKQLRDRSVQVESS